MTATPEPSDPVSAGPSQDLVRRFAALDAVARAPALHRADANTGLVSVPDRRGVSSRYTFEAVFASGGLGQIRRAYDHRLKRYVAAKELQHHRPGHPSEVRFLREALLTARLEHPSIVPIHDLGEHPTGEAFYCMKLIEGRSLDDLVAACSTFMDRLALVPHVLAVADALAYAHEKAIIHRDLKPGNVLIGAFGETLVIDWGLAKDLSLAADRPDDDVASACSSTSAADLTRTGELVGTLPFMPPEQAEGRVSDARADVYAIGAILYFVLSGHPPYGRSPARNMLAELLAGPPPDLGARVPGLPADLLAIVRKAMARDPLERYAGARALAADLRRFQAGRLVSARLYSALDLMQHFLRQHRTAVIWACVTLLIIVSFAVFSYTLILERKREAESQREEAVRQGDAARVSQAHAERLTRESEIAARDLYLETGRKKLFHEQNPQEAIVLLNEAYKLDRGHDITKLLLGQSTHSMDALILSSPYLAQTDLTLRYDADGAHLLLSEATGETVVLDGNTGEKLADLALTNDTITDAEFLNDVEDTVVTYTERGALGLFAAKTGVLRAYTPVAWETELASPRLADIRYLGLTKSNLALFTTAAKVSAVSLDTGRIEHSFSIPSEYHLQTHLYSSQKTNTVFSFWNFDRSRRKFYDILVAWDPGEAQNGQPAHIQLTSTMGATQAIGDGKIFAFEQAGDTSFAFTKPSPTVWDLNSGSKYSLSPCDDLPNFQGELLVLSPDGQDLFSIGNKRVVRWNIDTRQCAAVSTTLLKSSAGRGLRTTSIHAHSREHGLFLDNRGSALERFDYNDLSYHGNFVAHASPLETIALQPKGTRMTTVPLDGEIRMWSLEDPRILNRVSFSSGLTATSTKAGEDYQRIREMLRAPCSLLASGTMTPRTSKGIFSPQLLELDDLRLIAEPPRYDDGQIMRISQGCDIWSAPDWRRYDRLYSSSKELEASPQATIKNGRFLLMEWAHPEPSNGLFSTLVSLPDLAPRELYHMLRVTEITHDLHRGWGDSGVIERLEPRVTLPFEATDLGYETTGSPDGRYIVSQTLSSIVHVYEGTTGVLVNKLGVATNTPSRSSSSSLCSMPRFSPTWEFFIASQSDGTIDAWDALTFSHLKTLRGHTKRICGSEFAPDGTNVVTFDPSGGEAYLWALDDDSEGIKLETPDTNIVRFSPSGDMFATGDDEGVIRIWYTNGGHQVGEFRGHSARIERLVFAEDGTRLYSMDQKEDAVEWQIRRETRSPERLAGLIEQTIPYRLTGGRVVLK